MHRVSDIPIVMFNPHLVCKLCGGYLIDATTIVECLHSFCRSCILVYLKVHTTCPVCDTLLHKTRPHYAIRPDRALQAIVYKLIPNLFEKEMLCRRKFYDAHPSSDNRSLSPEKRGEITLNTYVLQEEDRLSVELQYWNQDAHASRDSFIAKSTANNFTPSEKVAECIQSPRSTYLLCPPELTVGHLEKLIRMKFNLKPGEHEVSVFLSAEDLFTSDYTLSDLAYLYAWRRQQPLKLYFSIKEIMDSSFASTLIAQTPTSSHLPCSSELHKTSLNHSAKINFDGTTTNNADESFTTSITTATSSNNVYIFTPKTANNAHNAPHISSNTEKCLSESSDRFLGESVKSDSTWADHSKTHKLSFAAHSVKSIRLPSPPSHSLFKSNSVCSPRA